VQLLAACVTPPRLCLVMELMDVSLDKLLYDNQLEYPIPVRKVRVRVAYHLTHAKDLLLIFLFYS
jgi:hypothetical protein